MAETPNFGRLAYLVLTDRELALITLRSGIVSVKLDEIVTRVPRAEVKSAELGNGPACPLTISFTNGGTWQVEVPRPSKRYAVALVRELAGSHNDY